MNAIRLSVLMAIVALGLFVPQAPAITWGEVDKNNTYSNVGAIVVALPGEEPFVGASGVLIHPRVLLTAGHVTRNGEENPWMDPFVYVSFSANALDPSTWHETIRPITHPQYRPGSSEYDVGVVILKKPVNIRKVPLQALPPEGFLDDLLADGLLREAGQGGAPFTHVGYGSTIQWPPPEMIPPDGWRRFADSSYLGLPAGWLVTQQNFATDDGGAAVGDSGGPVFWTMEDGTRVLVGVTSGADQNCLSMSSSWRVDLPETLDFIYDIIAMVDASLL